jgi:hypothetical protein
VLGLSGRQKSAKFTCLRENRVKSSKGSRKNGFLFGMEIFGGTYMRPRYSPCDALRGGIEKANLRLFWHFNAKSGFPNIACI